MASTFGFRPRLLASFSWKGVAVFFVFVIAMAAWTWSGMLLVPKKVPLQDNIGFFLGALQRNLYMFFPIYLLVGLADALPLRGRRRFAVLAGALVAGVLLAVQVRCGLSPGLKFHVGGKHIAYCASFPTWRTYLEFPNSVMQPLLVSGVVMILVFGWRRDRELVAALHEARAAQVEVRRQRIESEIDAMHSRVNPDQLFATLGTIRETYERNVDEGEALLDGLIEDLRQAARHPAAGTA